MGLDREVLERFLDEYRGWDRQALQREGLLKKGCPPKGTDLIDAQIPVADEARHCSSWPRTCSTGCSSATRPPTRASSGRSGSC